MKKKILRHRPALLAAGAVLAALAGTPAVIFGLHDTAVEATTAPPALPAWVPTVAQREVSTREGPSARLEAMAPG